MTLDQLIAAEQSAIDHWAWWHNIELTPAKRRRAYAEMRRRSEEAQAGRALPDVAISDCALQLALRAKEVLGIAEESAFYLAPDARRHA